MAENPYKVVLNSEQMNRIRVLLQTERDPKTRKSVDFACLSEAAKPIVGQANWDIMQKAKEAKCGCQVNVTWPETVKFPRRLDISSG